MVETRIFRQQEGSFELTSTPDGYVMLTAYTTNHVPLANIKFGSSQEIETFLNELQSFSKALFSDRLQKQHALQELHEGNKNSELEELRARLQLLEQARTQPMPHPIMEAPQGYPPYSYPPSAQYAQPTFQHPLNVPKPPAKSLSERWKENYKKILAVIAIIVVLIIIGQKTGYIKIPGVT